MSGSLREINLEDRMPTVRDAIRRLTFELHNSRRMQVAVLKIIHGYGSSGTGGKIRVEARAYLTRLLAKREIKSFLTGEQFSIFDEATRTAFACCPELRKDRDLERHNNGVTFILL